MIASRWSSPTSPRRRPGCGNCGSSAVPCSRRRGCGSRGRRRSPSAGWPTTACLGSLLATVVRDHRDGVAQTREQAERLSKLTEISNEIDRMDRRHRSSSGKPLQGSGRQDLVHLVERAVGLVKEWCLAVDGIRRGDRSDGNRAGQEVSALRQSPAGRRGSGPGRTGADGSARLDADSAAMAWAARPSMEELFALLAGHTATPRTGGPVERTRPAGRGAAQGLRQP
ncbi:hypothetical protein LT493_02145 [Streptomyces tricolor]|nr:hypothetical protein [Streptomyces tricolor]